MANFTEKSLVEDYIVNKLVEKGWRFVPADELSRETFEEPLLISDLTRQIEKINGEKFKSEGLELGGDEFKQAINELKLRASGQEGIKQILEFYKNGIPVKFEKERVVKYVQIFDYDNVGNNEFVISRQVNSQSADRSIRADIMLYVNGIPLIIIECKNPASFSSSWYDAYKQIKKYEKDIPELFKYAQLGIAVEKTAYYFPIVPWQEDVKIYEWKEENKDSVDSLLEMLEPTRILDIIKNFLFYRIESGEATKVVTRYMQYRAVNKIVARVLNNIAGKEEKNKGLIWHWQGSGKTLTMIFASYKLRNNDKLESPTVFFVVDRDDLETQLNEEFSALGIEPYIVDSVEDLKSVIEHDDYRGRRDIIITLIHKFRPGELEGLVRELDKKDVKGSIRTRKNVITFIDEGHRTQYGTLAAQMKNVLKGGFFFAFTGTPISKEGRDTYNEFSYPPTETYFDKYFITDSIKDGFTVKIAYQPRLERDVHLKKEELEAFISLEGEEIPEEFREDAKEEVRKKINKIKAYLENPERIEKIAKDIKEHFSGNVDGKFKAMVVAVSRKACVLYKRELDKYLPKEFSEVVMTYNQNDDEIISGYLRELLGRNKGLDIEQIKKETITKYKEQELPKLLIVTDMLLTGFDAPILQTMYLDKPLKEHRLLQAIARTNRPYKGEKEAGLIIDYAGILNNFKKAFEIYSKDDVKGVLHGIEEFKEDFAGLINRLLEIFKELQKNVYDRKVLLKAMEILTSDENICKKFVEDYRSLRRIFELLGPDEIKLDYFNEYKWLTAIYVYYSKEVMTKDGNIDTFVEKYFDKTIKHVYETTEIEELNKNLPQIAFDDKYFVELNKKINNREERAANIVFTLNRFVLVDKDRNPVFMTIADKVEQILKKWKEKNKDYEAIYNEGATVLREIEKLKSRQKELGLNNLEYSILLVLEKEIGKRQELEKDVKDLCKILKEEMFNGWVLQSTIRKNIEREIRSFLRREVVKYKLNYEKINEMYDVVKGNISKYEASE